MKEAIKTKMKKAIWIIALQLVAQTAAAQKNTNNNFIYVMPTSIGGDLFWDLDNYWLEAGYARTYGKDSNQVIDCKIGAIVYAKTSYNSLLNDIDSKKTSGFNINLENKSLLGKHFYYSTNLFYQYTQTLREGEFDRSIYKYVSNNTYTVIRNVYCLYPKVGFQFISKRNLFTDVGLGIGLRYISSYSKNKINTQINSGSETFAKKEFDKGSKFAQKINFQIKIGYNF